jgi:stage V sporulation protein B
MRVAGSFLQPLIAVLIPARLTAVGYTSTQALSLYGVAVGMTMPLLYAPTTIIGSISTALIPDISTAMAQNNQKHIEQRIKSSIFYALLISAYFVPLFLGMGEQIGIFLYDNILSGTLLVSSAWVLIPLGLTNITSAILNSLGLERKSFIHFVIGAIAMFIALWVLPSFIGINALVFAMGIDYLITMMLNLILIKKKVKIELSLGKTILKLLVVIVSFTVSLCEYVFPLFITLVIGVVVGSLSFVLLAGVVNIVNFKAVLIYIKNKTGIDKIRLKKSKN